MTAKTTDSLTMANSAEDTYRPSTAYPCARDGCGKRSVVVRIRRWYSDREASIAFYGECEEHRSDKVLESEREIGR